MIAGTAAVVSAATQPTYVAPASTTVVYQSVPPAPSLPCAVPPTVVNGVSYFVCGNAWYSQAYGGSGVMYVQVAPPPGY